MELPFYASRRLHDERKRLLNRLHYFSGQTGDTGTLLPLVDLLDVTGSNPA